MPHDIQVLGRVDVAVLRGMLAMFGRAFEDEETYGSRPPPRRRPGRGRGAPPARPGHRPDPCPAGASRRVGRVGRLRAGRPGRRSRDRALHPPRSPRGRAALRPRSVTRLRLRGTARASSRCRASGATHTARPWTGPPCCIDILASALADASSGGPPASQARHRGAARACGVSWQRPRCACSPPAAPPRSSTALASSGNAPSAGSCRQGSRSAACRAPR